MHDLLVFFLVITLWPSAWCLGNYVGFYILNYDEDHPFHRSTLIGPWRYNRWHKENYE